MHDDKAAIVSYISRMGSKDFSNFLERYNISDSSIDAITKSAHETKLKKGQSFCPEFDKHAVNYLKSGLLKNEVELTEETSRAASFVLPDWGFSGAPPSSRLVASYTALTDCVIISVPGNRLRVLTQSDPMVFDLTLQVYTHQLYHERNWWILSSVIDKKQHILLSLFFLSFYQINGKEKVIVRHKDLADISGVTIPYVISTINEKLTTGAFRKCYGGIEILDQEKFIEIVDWKLIQELIEHNPQIL